jgi:L-alanine-DL-glutamate epimerase-like enolase superfamily enzyme
VERNHTDVVYVELNHESLTGYGEAALPPYVEESAASVIQFLSSVDLSKFSDPVKEFDSILDFVNGLLKKNHSAKAAFDMALHDLYGKLIGKPLYKIWNLDREKTPVTVYTIGMGSRTEVREKIKAAANFSMLKIKLGSPIDNLILKTLKEETGKPFTADANGGWHDEQFALDMIHLLSEMGGVLVEQPFTAHEKKKSAWLRERSPLPVYGDEAIQTIDDMQHAEEFFHGVNIKLMKCGGLRNANRMIKMARKKKMQVMIGCMSESSCGVSAAAHLSPLCDYADLDGPLLISNDPFKGIEFSENGKIILKEATGHGAVYAN